MALKLNRRDKIAFILAGGSIFLFILVQFLIYPLIDKNRNLERNIKIKTKVLDEIQTVKSEYDIIQKKTETSKRKFSKRKSDFTLFSFVDRLAGEAGVKENIAYMKPSTSTQSDSQYKISIVEMKLQSLNMEQLTNYLYMLESSQNMVSVKRISISKTSNNNAYIDAVLQVETIEI